MVELSNRKEFLDCWDRDRSTTIILVAHAGQWEDLSVRCASQEMAKTSSAVCMTAPKLDWNGYRVETDGALRAGINIAVKSESTQRLFDDPV